MPLPLKFPKNYTGLRSPQAHGLCRQECSSTGPNVPAPALLAYVVLRLKPIPSLMLSKHSHQLSLNPSPRLPSSLLQKTKMSSQADQ